jgi:hypothetical protein
MSPDRQESIAGHLWFAALLFAGLTLPTLQPFGEDDRWLGIGTVMLTVALATWLPLRWLAPAVLVVWITPFVASRVVDDGFTDPGVDAEAVLQLLGLLFVAGGVSLAYRRLAAGSRAAAAPAPQAPQSEVSSPGPDADVSGAPLVPTLAPMLVRRFPGARLERREAASLLQRLSALRRELSETQGQLWGLVQDGRAH